MGTNCAPLVADLFLFCYERDLLMSLSEEKRSEVIKSLSSTSRYLDELLNIDNNYFDGLISQIYHSELQLNKAKYFDTEVPVFDLYLSSLSLIHAIFMIKAMVLILRLLILLAWMGVFLVEHPTVFIYRN